MSDQATAPGMPVEAAPDCFRETVSGQGETGKRPHAVYPDRWADGTTRAGFAGPALKHGGHSAIRRLERARTRQEQLDALLSAIQLPTPIERTWARLFVEADELSQDLTTWLDQVSALDARGRQRAAVAGRRLVVAQLLDLGTKLQAAITRRTDEQPGAALREYLATRQEQA